MTARLSPELCDLLALSLVPGLGPRLTAALLRHFGSAAAVRRAAAGQLRQVPQIGAKLSEDFAAALATVDVDAEIALLERHDTGVIALGDPPRLPCHACLLSVCAHEDSTSQSP